MSFDVDQHSVKKILGLQWLPSLDVFTYNVDTMDCPPTKRNILSQISRIFDPLGWLTPVVLWAKQLIQQLWTEGLNWDDLPSHEIQCQWTRFALEFSCLKEIFIPRLVLPKTFTDLQVHGFCDASEKGFAGAVYFRVTHNDSSVSTHLVIAKSRVSPLKRISIPRLELCGAVLLTKLLDFCKSFLMQIPNLKWKTYAWTDSTVVLNWIHTSPHLLKTFVANRVSLIQESTSPTLWFHAPGESNPADCASRGIFPHEIIHHPFWWSGPPWLLTASELWPPQDIVNKTQEDVPELRKVLCALTTEEPTVDLTILERFSSLSQLKRITAWCLRFYQNCKSKKLKGLLTVSELNDALIIWIKNIQQKYFPSDLISLQTKGLAKSQGILRLDPFLDEDGVIRVGGRLRHSTLAFQNKHPSLLPKEGHLTALIIDSYHKVYLHAGPKLLQSILSKEFWICSARNTIRKRLSKCVQCTRFRASLPQPFMSDLPAVRLQCSRPFLSCGIDFAGPFQTKSNALRKSQLTKSYLCIYICMSTKAVHLEAVSSLSAKDFLASFSRFTARRGLPHDVYSDMGTNFVAAAKDLTEMHKLLSKSPVSEVIQKSLTDKGVQWHFNPPSAPHFGGIWEAAVKSAKFHLRRVIGIQIFTFEELSTLFAEVEAVMNSRPLSPLSPDPNENNVLTPGHFLIGEALTAVPSPDVTDIKLNRLTRWQLVQQATQHFWRRWSSEYLHNLQQRGKWTQHIQNLQVGDLVLIKDPNLPPLYWPTGRIVAVHPGKDNTVRVVTLQTSSGQLKRPVVKLCPLPKE